MDIREVQTIKHDRVFLLCNRFGDIPYPNNAALGLYYMDTRFLSRYELLLDGIMPSFLHSDADRNYSMVVETTVPIATVDPGGVQVNRNISILRHRWLEGGLKERIRVQNFGSEPRRLRLDLFFDSDFLDLFEVRGLKREKGGELQVPLVSESSVQLSYVGLDDVRRELDIRFEPAPRKLKANSAYYRLDIAPQKTATIEIQITPRAGELEPPATTLKDLEDEYSLWRKESTRFVAPNSQLHTHLSRAVLDFKMMQSNLDGTPVLDAGVPWFSTLFGRDSLIAAYMGLGVCPDLGRSTIEKLAEYQGLKSDDWREEDPGKILHEVRRGELAGYGAIPHTPYYGSADATPLWLVLYGRLWNWTADREFAERFWPNALRALEWIDKFGDMDGDGYVEYKKRSPNGLDNQGWKDSRDGIVGADGSSPDPPIALVEIQGYIYHGKRQAAEVGRALGETDIAAELEDQAAKLRKRFNEDFWMESEGYYAVALDGNKKQVKSITSNPGHCLWSGIIDAERTAKVVARLLEDDLLCGWGIRTLSSSNPAYDPVGYHTGSAWPHDGALIAQGMKHNGFDLEANSVVDQLAQAGALFRGGRFPELFCGFARGDVPLPVEYPVACRPQAWATGAALLMVRTLGGIVPDAPNKTLYILRPSLPSWLEAIQMLGMRVGGGKVDLEFLSHHGGTSCRVLSKEGDLDVLVRY